MADLLERINAAVTYVINEKPRAPKGWWAKMEKEVKKGNPKYSDEKVRATIGNIWANKLTDAKRAAIKKRYYGKKSK